MESTVGIRELKRRLSEVLRGVKAGGTVIVTDRGRPIGRIVPIEQPLAPRLEALETAGMIAWSGQTLREARPPARVRGDVTVADLLLDARA